REHPAIERETAERADDARHRGRYHRRFDRRHEQREHKAYQHETAMRHRGGFGLDAPASGGRGFYSIIHEKRESSLGRVIDQKSRLRATPLSGHPPCFTWRGNPCPPAVR